MLQQCQCNNNNSDSDNDNNEHFLSVFDRVNIGFALLDVFNVVCTGWVNCLGVENERLAYNHYVEYKDDMSALPVYSGHNTSASLMFQPLRGVQGRYVRSTRLLRTQHQRQSAVSTTMWRTRTICPLYPSTLDTTPAPVCSFQ